jgi:DNA helicase-2/ATP-dependent DNA helicase PcrA
MEGYNEEEEAQLVVREIGRYVDSGNYVLGDISVMYRVNAQSRAFEMACQRYGVPYQVVGGIKFYQRREVKDLIAYLRLILNPHDDISLSRVINVPTRGIGQRTLDELTRTSVTLNLPIFSVIENLSNGKAESISIPIQLGARAIKAVEDFKTLIDNLRSESEKQNLIELIDSVITRTGFRHHLENDEQSEERIDNIEEFRSSAREYAQSEGQEALITFMESIALVSDIDGMEENLDFLTLITLHQAKGLEFPVVFITGMEEGLLPHIRSIDTGDPRELEEERRLCYVGMTRAKERLHLIRAFRRGFRGGSEPSAPSRFISEIPRELIYIPGQTENEGIETSLQDNKIGSSASPSVKNSTQSFKPSRSEASHSFESSSRKNPPTERMRLPGSKHLQAQRVVPVRRRRVVNKIVAPHSKLSFKTGDKVKHPSFGEGIVLNFEPSGDDVQVTVAFKESLGVKKLMAGVAKLEKL